MFIYNQFVTHTIDHFIFLWGFAYLTAGFDYYLYKRDSWSTFKKNPYVRPTSVFNIVKLVLFNQLFITIPFFYLWGNFPEQGSIYQYANLYRFPLAILCFEFLFYYLHRLLHFSFLYKYIHYLHHSWNFPMGISATYAHPIEHILTNVLPIIISAHFANFNFATARLWHFFVLFNATVLAHGGYKIPGYNNMHDRHHTNHLGNFGAIGLLDRWHNTYVQ